MIKVAPIPENCPEHLLDALTAARTTALVHLSEVVEADRKRNEAQRLAETAVLHYSNLLLEVQGQGTLDLDPEQE